MLNRGNAIFARQLNIEQKLKLERTIMSDQHKCPKCGSENTYQDMNLWVCPDCFHEWDPSEQAEAAEAEAQASRVVDSNGNVLSDGD